MRPRRASHGEEDGGGAAAAEEEEEEEEEAPFSASREPAQPKQRTLPRAAPPTGCLTTGHPAQAAPSCEHIAV